MHKFTPYKPRRTIISIPVKKEKRKKENPISPELDAFATIQTWPIDYKSRRVQISALEEEHERIRECHPPPRSIGCGSTNRPTESEPGGEDGGGEWDQRQPPSSESPSSSPPVRRERRGEERVLLLLLSPLLSSLCFALPNSRRRRQRAQ